MPSPPPPRIDRRLYTPVRPRLEYAIPEAGTAALSALLGDASADHARRALRRCLPPHHPSAAEEGEEGEGGDDGDDGDDPLCEHRAQCERVCGMAVEYVRQLEEAWVDFLTRASTSLRRDLRAVEEEVARARAVHARYRARGREVADDEYRAELELIRKRMDAALDAHRAAEPPSLARPEAMVSASAALRELFASSYGKVPTAQLTAQKARFEAQMQQLQDDVARSFAARVEPLLPPPTPP